MVSVTQFCLGTMVSIRENDTTMKVLRLLDGVTSVWFTVEFCLRLIFSPGYKSFVTNPLNWIDLLAVLPFYLSVYHIGTTTTWLVVMRTFRIFRIFNLSFSFQILFHTLISSKSELFLVFLSLIIPIIVFSSMIYFAENEMNKEMFPSIPESFWWAIVTVTTLGYGDVVPVTKLGKTIGAMCAICGVIILALPVSVIGSNFSYFYMHACMRIQQPCRSPRTSTLTHVPVHLMYKRLGRRRSASASDTNCNLRAKPSGSHWSNRRKTSFQYRRGVKRQGYQADRTSVELSQFIKCEQETTTSSEDLYPKGTVML